MLFVMCDHGQEGCAESRCLCRRHLDATYVTRGECGSPCASRNWSVKQARLCISCAMSGFGTGIPRGATQRGEITAVHAARGSMSEHA
jgi:hypothetical protein